MNPDGAENLNPEPPFRIRLPKTLKSDTHALPGDQKSSSTTTMNDTTIGGGPEKEKLIVEPYVPADPGPYPQDQPKQNSVRFTPTQVLSNSSYLFPYPKLSDLFCHILFFCSQCVFLNSLYCIPYVRTCCFCFKAFDNIEII